MPRYSAPRRILSRVHVETERAARERVSGLIKPVSPDFAAELERVFPSNPGNVVHELKNGRPPDKRSVPLLSESAEPETEADGWGTVRERHRRIQTDDSKFARDIALERIEAALIVIELRPAEAEFVDQRRPEGVNIR